METFSPKNSPSRGSSSPSINSTDPGQFLTYSRDCSCIQGTVHVFKGLFMYSSDSSCIQGTVHVFKGLFMYSRDCSCIQGTRNVFKGLFMYSSDFPLKNLFASSLYNGTLFYYVKVNDDNIIVCISQNCSFSFEVINGFCSKSREGSR